MRTGGDELARLGERRLLDERLGDVGARARRLAAFDVAETRLGHRRRDAERDEAAFARELGAAQDGGSERGLVADQVIRGKHQHHGVVAVTCAHEQCGDRHRRRGIAAEGLEEIGGVAWLGLVEARIDVLGVEVQVAIGHGDQSARAGNPPKPACRLAKQGVAVRKRHERLGRGFAR